MTMGVPLSNSTVTAVAAIVHPPGEGFWIMEQDLHEWSWHVMVAQLDLESLRYVVEDGDCSRGLVRCEFRRRPNSYDHGRQVQRGAPNHKLMAWDFILVRSDGSAVRLHPEWNKTRIRCSLWRGIRNLSRFQRTA